MTSQKMIVDENDSKFVIDMCDVWDDKYLRRWNVQTALSGEPLVIVAE